MNYDFVSMNSKTEYYDSARILSKWGFTDSQCHNCGISNSDINGLLMQCGKCKRAYYCSMKCFNDHLPEHNKYCGTKSIDCQPKGTGVELTFKEKPVLDDVEKPKNDVKKKSVQDVPEAEEHEFDSSELVDSVSDLQAPATGKKKKKQKAVPQKDSPNAETPEFELSELMDSVSELQAPKTKTKKKQKPQKTQEVPAVEEPEFDLNELMNSVSDLQAQEPQQKEETSSPTMSQSFSDFGRGKPRNIAQRDSFVKEQVLLRHTEFTKNEYPWMTPEWINAQLRKTERGRKLLEQGDLCGPVTDIQSLIDQGYISWKKPDWTQPKLRHLQAHETKMGTIDSAMSRSFSDFGRDYTPEETQDKVCLRHTEFANIKNEYSWMTPEWINAQLRKTERGRKLLEQGDLCGPVTDIQKLIDEGYISWEKPEWTQPKLRKTARGEAIVREAIAHENSFKEERANNSFSNYQSEEKLRATTHERRAIMSRT